MSLDPISPVKTTISPNSSPGLMSVEELEAELAAWEWLPPSVSSNTSHNNGGTVASDKQKSSTLRPLSAKEPEMKAIGEATLVGKMA